MLRGGKMVKMEGGAEIFIPKKRNKKVKYPKSFDAQNPGQAPDPERWLPKWQRSKYKKLAKKRGIYLKGAQGDSQFDTDVTNKAQGASTAHVQVSANNNQNKNKRNKRK